jgi:hypothetical protein
MRVLALIVFAATAFGQKSDRSDNAGFMYDINGRRVPLPASTSGSGGGSQSIQDINGRVAPIEKTEENVLVDTKTERVVERIVRRYDRNGNPGPIEKIRIEENKAADGSSSIMTTVMRSDLNGNLALYEKSAKQTQVSGDTQTFTSEIQRPTLNGSVEIVEKQAGRIQTTPATQSEDTTVLRKDANGRFVEALREVAQKNIEEGKTTENRTRYSATNGVMALERQEVSQTEKLADGTVVKDTSIYSNASTGRPSAAGPQLREQQRVVRQKVGDEVKEVLSIRRPSLGDQKELGEFVKVGEKTCTGKCE